MNSPFDDSGVHLELAAPSETDVSEIDGVTDGRNGLAVDSGKFSDIMIERRGLSSSVKEEGVECKGSAFLVPGIELNSSGKPWRESVTMGLKSEEIIFSGVDLPRGGSDHDESAYLEITGDEVKEKSLV